MNNIDMLTALVESEPADDILGLMLRDALMEERDMYPGEAAQHVALVQGVALDAKAMREATQILSMRTRRVNALGRAIALLANVTPGTTTTIMVVPGTAGPQAHAAPTSNATGGWMSVVVVVGARWVLSFVEGERAARRAARAEKKQRANQE